MVLAPLTTVPFGRGRVIASVAKPPPMPPKLLPGSAIVTVLLLRGIQALILTWTLACSAYRTPWICSQRDRADSACSDCRVTVLLTAVPSALNTSMGNNIRSVVVSANPMGMVMATRNRSSSRSGRLAMDRIRQTHLPTDRALSVGLRPHAFFRGTTFLGRWESRGSGSVSSNILLSLDDSICTFIGHWQEMLKDFFSVSGGLVLICWVIVD